MQVNNLDITLDSSSFESRNDNWHDAFKKSETPNKRTKREILNLTKAKIAREQDICKVYG